MFTVQTPGYGDEPYIMSPKGHRRPQTPHTRTIGGTLEVSFILPRPDNLGNTRPRKRKATTPTQKVQANAAKSKPARPAMKPLLTVEQKQELRQVRAAENRQRRKELGLCKDCLNKAIKGQSRCSTCLENNRQRRKRQKAETDQSP